MINVITMDKNEFFSIQYTDIQQNDEGNGIHSKVEIIVFYHGFLSNKLALVFENNGIHESIVVRSALVYNLDYILFIVLFPPTITDKLPTHSSHI